MAGWQAGCNTLRLKPAPSLLSCVIFCYLLLSHVSHAISDNFVKSFSILCNLILFLVISCPHICIHVNIGFSLLLTNSTASI